MANMGLVQAARQIESYGRGPDTELAHISPDEAQFVDYLQGGRRVNPHTGLAEYSMFGKILKSVARVAGAVGGFMVGGPLGAAAGAGAATKLTGGSWKDSLKAAAISGVGSYATQGLSGGGWGLTGGAAAGAAGAAGSYTPAVDFSPLAGAGANTVAQGGASLAAAAPGLAAASAAPATGLASIKQLTAPIGGLPGAVAGLGALSVPMPQDMDSGPSGPPPGYGGNINLNIVPQQRAYRPYQGDYAKFGEQGGYKFFDEVNPKPVFLAEGGGVMSPRQPGNGIMGLGSLHQLGVPSQIQSPGIADPMQARALGRDMSPGAQRDEIRRAAIMGYVNARDGGRISGPGTETSDSIPAMLSENEHVIDAGTVRALGHGSVDRGHKAIDRLKRKARASAGVKNPKKPPAFQGAH